MPANVSLPEVIAQLSKHEDLGEPVETYVVIIEFASPTSNEILRFEQEFGESYGSEEMEVKRRSCVRIREDSDKTSPLILSMLDFER
jgi:hypothetical protein